MATATFNPRGKDDFQAKEQLEKAKDAGGQAVEKVKEGVEKAKDAGWQAADKAKEALDKAREAGVLAVKETAASVGDMATHAASAVGKKADDLTATAGADIKKLGDRIEEKGPHEGMLGHASKAVADTFRESGKYIEDAKLSGMTEDVAQLIRRNPIPAVLVGIGVGVMIGMTLRG
jgi:ElaB/YqjD/DUF883 family membrane-anchored ribosome-binding protein